MRMSSEQQAIIEYTGANLLVAAAAGSGKTRVLVERILHLLLNQGCSLDNMLVATFTNAAAAEMKSRIAARLSDAIESPALQARGSSASIQARGGPAAFLVQELGQLNQAQISTLHSFCTEIVRSHFHNIGVDPAFRVADSSESELLKREALEEVLEEYSEKAPEDMLVALDMFSSPFSDQGLQNLILRLHGYIMSRPDPWEWLQKQLEALEVRADELHQTPWWLFLEKLARQELDESRAFLRRVVDSCQGLPELKKMQSFAAGELEGVEQLLSAGPGQDFARSLHGFSPGRRPRLPAKMDSRLAADIAAARDQAKELIQRARGRLPERDMEVQAREYAAMKPCLEFIARLLRAYDLRYWSLKQERGLLDFSDLEHKALEALQDNDCARVYRQRFEYIFVDEYQDTSPIQEALLTAVSRGGNLFMVGDVKQSIYRFRLADPAIFLAKYRGYGLGGEAGEWQTNETGFGAPEPGDCGSVEMLNDELENEAPAPRGCLKLLDRNYRSSGIIINAVNCLFSRLMTEESGEIDYRLNPLKAGRPGGSAPEPEEAAPDQPVELLLLDNSAGDGQDDGGEDSGENRGEDIADNQGDDTWEGPAGGSAGESPEGPGAGGQMAILLEDMKQLEKEAWMLAGRIRRMISGAESINDRGIGRSRPLQYRDICILMRATAGTAGVFSQVFRQAGIPLYVETAGAYFDSLEIQLVMNLLRLVDNKRQDLALVSVMHGPFFDFSLAELAEIRIQARAGQLDGQPADQPDKQPGDQSFCAAVEYCASHGPAPLAGRCRQLLEQLEKWKQEARFLNLDGFIWKLLMDTGFYYYASAMPGGRQRAANLDLLLEKARSFEASTLKGLFNFIAFVDRLKAGGQDGGAAPIIGENDDVVRMMSIHKSKGLEFPVLIVAGLGRQFNTRDSAARLLLHGEMGLGPSYIDTERRVYSDTLARQAISSRLRLESQAEEMRILYVAMTRAEERLILCGSLKSLESSIRKWQMPAGPAAIRQARSCLDWIGPILLRHQQAGQQLRQVWDVSLTPQELYDDPSCWEIRPLSPREVMELPLAQSAGPGPGPAAGGQELAPEAGPGEDPRLCQVLRALDWQYPHAQAAVIPSKMSVTSVKRFRSWREVEQEAYQEMARPLELGRPRFAAGEARAALTPAEAGTINHLVLQQLDLERVGSPGQIQQQLDEMREREILSPAEAELVKPELIYSFYGSRLGQRLLSSPRVRREVAFNLKIPAGELLGGGPDADEELLLQGIIDLFFEEGGQLVLVDYKSDHPGRARDEILDSYGLQINLYRQALEQIQKRPVKAAYIYMLASGECIEVPVHRRREGL